MELSYYEEMEFYTFTTKTPKTRFFSFLKNQLIKNLIHEKSLQITQKHTFSKRKTPKIYFTTSSLNG